ncbi:hypothetical protein A1A1_18595 [Planococcus antarcticus DSM 14505]|uniref:Uncharacterized protein n=1 Tax=Planococcus antarcticus DSM 14505 TaxID=1185653 RepID=A0A1C7DHG1_9BACL|nr:hypothetical protein [Planococcus antarcticus]ANU10874.1 hypothetical protein BBH88_11405 [Planococcus antarcticus DSM 14505]EIM04980.1 hypothetical protein A1A1_18595 [Planococcus antarcticus DSM 14505]
MKDRLNEYRNALNSTVFKDNQFKAEHKQQVLVKLNQRPEPKKRKDWMPRAMSVAFIAFLLLAGGYFLSEQLGKSPVNIAEPTSEQGLPQRGDTGLPVEETKQEEEDSVLESPYLEISDYFTRYELPEEGRLDSSEAVNGVSYENGYTFNKDKKYMVGRIHYEGTGPKEPTEGQEVGVIMGWIAGAAAIQHPENQTAYMTLGILDPPLTSLGQAKELNDFEPLEEWIIEVEDLLKHVQSSENEEERKQSYEEAYEMLQKMYSIVEGQ